MKVIISIVLLLFLGYNNSAQSQKFKWVLLDSYIMDSTVGSVFLYNKKYLNNILEVRIGCSKGDIVLGSFLRSEDGKITLSDLTTVISPTNNFDISDWFKDSLTPFGFYFSNTTSSSGYAHVYMLAKIKVY